jgi:hypothetical protein
VFGFPLSDDMVAILNAGFDYFCKKKSNFLPNFRCEVCKKLGKEAPGLGTEHVKLACKTLVI